LAASFQLWQSGRLTRGGSQYVTPATDTNCFATTELPSTAASTIGTVDPSAICRVDSAGLKDCRVPVAGNQNPWPNLHLREPRATGAGRRTRVVAIVWH
jgi:hypothetical protein